MRAFDQDLAKERRQPVRSFRWRRRLGIGDDSHDRDARVGSRGRPNRGTGQFQINLDNIRTAILEPLSRFQSFPVKADVVAQPFGCLPTLLWTPSNANDANFQRGGHPPRYHGNRARGSANHHCLALLGSCHGMNCSVGGQAWHSQHPERMRGPIIKEPALSAGRLVWWDGIASCIRQGLTEFRRPDPRSGRLNACFA